MPKKEPGVEPRGDERTKRIESGSLVHGPARAENKARNTYQEIKDKLGEKEADKFKEQFEPELEHQLERAKIIEKWGQELADYYMSTFLESLGSASSEVREKTNPALEKSSNSFSLVEIDRADGKKREIAISGYNEVQEEGLDFPDDGAGREVFELGNDLFVQRITGFSLSRVRLAFDHMNEGENDYRLFLNDDQIDAMRKADGLEKWPTIKTNIDQVVIETTNEGWVCKLNEEAWEEYGKDLPTAGEVIDAENEMEKE